MEEKNIDIAINIIKLKIAKEIKENKSKDYNELKKRIQMLRKEEKQVYEQNDEIIRKVLTQYAKDIKN